MKLPNSKNAIISKEKLTDYLLSKTHATGKFKAKFFRNLGFDEANADLFEESIRKLIQVNEIKEEFSSPYGRKYVIDGKIDTPSEGLVMVRTVWIIEKGQKKSRF